MENRARGILLVVAATTCWASESLMVRLVSADDWQILFWSGSVMAVVLGLALSAGHGAGLLHALRATGLPGLIACLSLAAAYSGYIFALNRTTVANTVVLMGTAPLFAALMGRAFLGERVSRRTWISMAFAIAGVAVMVGDSRGAGRLSGDLIALATGFLYAVNVVALRAAPARNGQKVDMLPSNAAAGVVIAAIAVTRGTPMAVGSGDLGILLAIGLVSMGLGTWLFTRGVRHLQAAEAGLLCLLEAVIAPLLVWAVLDEMPTFQALAGAGIVLAALIYDTLPARRTRTVGD